MPQESRLPFAPDQFFHLHYHSEAKPIFHIDGNYMFFLVRLNKILKPVGKVYAYCLMPQDIHLLIKTEDREALFSAFLEEKHTEAIDAFAPDAFVQKHIDELKEVYSKAVQKLFKEDEEVFGHYFKKVQVAEGPALLQTIRDIHLAPVKAGLAPAPKDWKHSSYVNTARENRTFEMGAAVLEHFGGRESFLNYHLSPEGGT